MHYNTSQQLQLQLALHHRRSQEFVWVHFFPQKKVGDLFLVVALKNGLKLLNEPLPPPNLPRPAKNVLVKIDSCFAWGCTWCAGGTLTNFPCKLRLKFFLRPGGAGAPTAPPGYAYALHVIIIITIIIISSSSNNNNSV